MDLKEQIKQIILDRQNLIGKENFTERTLKIERIPKKATIVTGVRRSGKSIFEQIYMQNLLKNGIKKEQICFIDFSDDRLFELRNSEPSIVAQSYYELFPENHWETVYFFFDEIQYLNHWELFVNRLQTTEKCEINITGSSAKLLVKEIATEFSGRSMNWELFPFSFLEFVSSRMESTNNHFDKKRMTSSQIDFCRKWFLEYLETGGFPESALISSEKARNLFFQNISDSVVFRDVIQRYNLSNSNEISRLQQILYGNMSKLISFSKLHQRLTGEQLKISKDMISQIISHFEDAYAFFTLEILSPNQAVRSTNPKKLYCIDHALAKNRGGTLSFDNGLALENMVFIELRRKTENIHYYKTKSGKEIDFAVGNFDSVDLIQVSWDISDAETYQREISALKEAMYELNVKIATIVTNDTEDTVEFDNGSIQIIPAWKWLMNS